MYVETDRQNLRLLPGRFSPTSGLLSAVDYLEPKLLRFQGLICRINHFCNPIGLEFIAKNVKNINFTFLQICKKKTGKYFLFTFLAITSIIIKLEKHTIWQIKPLNLIYIIYFMLYSDKMTTNMRNTVIFEGKHLSEELKSSKKRLIMMLSLKCLKT